MTYTERLFLILSIGSIAIAFVSPTIAGMLMRMVPAAVTYWVTGHMVSIDLITFGAE